MIKRMTLLGLAVVALGAAVHPEATLKSERGMIEAGRTMVVTGENFVAGDAVELMLQGALAEYELLNVTPEEGGVFSIEIHIPADVRAGDYRIVAIASDGDVSARLDLSVMAAAPSSDDHDEMGGDDHGDEGMAGMTAAREDELPIERSRSGLGWGIMGLLIGLAAGGGTVLVRT
jgi:hypothetical protein